MVVGVCNCTFHDKLSISFPNMYFFNLRMEACVFQGTFDESIVYDDNMIDDLRDMAVAILGMHLSLELLLIWLLLYK